MKRSLFCMLALCATFPLAGQAFNGGPDNQVDSYDYYYAITGGKFPNGQTLTGTPEAQSVFAMVADDPIWGRPVPLGQWEKDGWFAQNAGLALTMWNGATVVYDNNGIEDGSYGDYYSSLAQGTTDAATPGLYTAYAMSNNFDYLYAGYFKVTEQTTITAMTGYFNGDGYSNFMDPASFDYRMNFWSMADGLFPTNTGGFTGDVFNSDVVDGVFGYSDTGVYREYTDGHTDPIWRLTYELADPFVLEPGEYWFAHDALIPETVPEPATMTLLATGLMGLAAAKRRKRAQ